MLKRLSICCAFIAILALGSAHATDPDRALQLQATKSFVPKRIRLEGTGYEISLVAPGSRRGGMPPAQALLQAVAGWLATKFALPSIAAVPSVELVSKSKLAVFHYTGLLSDDPRALAAIPPGQRETVAAYDEGSRTIYLPLDWTGSTPAELSVLVHEMVHHLQNIARLSYECPQAREELAYAAQEAWLRLFGRSLAADFDIDPFTLLVSSRCPY